MAHIVKSPVGGSVWKIEVAMGDTVNAGDDIMILASMQTEVPVEVQASGMITAITVEEGDDVTEGDALATIE